MRVIQCIIPCRTQAYYAYPIKAPVVVAVNAVLLLPAVPGMLEHPAIPNKNTLAVIQSNRWQVFVDSLILVIWFCFSFMLVLTHSNASFKLLLRGRYTARILWLVCS
jgi:hypothetical protein